MTPEAWAVLLGGGGLASLVGSLLLFFSTRGKTRADAKAAADARIDKRLDVELARIYARLDEFEDRDWKRTAEFTRILRAIARQWPTPDGPDLDPADIAEIEETIPPEWLRANPPKEKP